MKKILILSICILLLSSCTIPEGQSQPNDGETEESQANLPNPASVYCEENGGIVEIRTDAEGNQYGFCIFPDDSECDEWAYYRDECQPGDSNQPGAYLPNPASVYCEENGGIVEIRTDAEGNQYGYCIFPDGSECDEWAYYRDECQPGDSNQPGAYLPNPASVYCEENGGTIQICTDADGNQFGYCVFQNGSICDEWAYYRGECVPSDDVDQGWSTYHNEQMNFSFQYPADAEIEVDSDIDTVFVTGPVIDDNAWPSFMISYPLDREDYQVPAGEDLQEWLVDHNLYVDQLAASRSIAGKTALHTRFAGSQQAYAHDKYFFVHDEQLFVITIGHTGGIEDWEVYGRFLNSIQFNPSPDDQITPTSIPTAIPINPDDYQGWWTYTHHTYGFTIMLPEDWIVDETTTFDRQMNNHILNIHPTVRDPEGCGYTQNIQLSFRSAGEDSILWPTGVGQGEFVTQGTLVIADVAAIRKYLVCPTGEITAIWYHGSQNEPNIQIGNMEFGAIFTGAPSHCETGYTLGGKTQRVGEMIIASIQVP